VVGLKETGRRETNSRRRREARLEGKGGREGREGKEVSSSLLRSPASAPPLFAPRSQDLPEIACTSSDLDIALRGMLDSKTDEESLGRMEEGGEWKGIRKRLLVVVLWFQERAR